MRLSFEASKTPHRMCLQMWKSYSFCAALVCPLHCWLAWETSQFLPVSNGQLTASCKCKEWVNGNCCRFSLWENEPILSGIRLRPQASFHISANLCLLTFLVRVPAMDGITIHTLYYTAGVITNHLVNTYSSEQGILCYYVIWKFITNIT
jgi:hypothetical protein